MEIIIMACILMGSVSFLCIVSGINKIKESYLWAERRMFEHKILNDRIDREIEREGLDRAPPRECYTDGKTPPIPYPRYPDGK